MSIKFFVVIIQLIYSTISIADIIGMNYKNGIVSTTALKYTNHSLTKSVSVVGIIHYGTNHYYHRIAQYLESLEEETILLDEFTRCDTPQTFALDFNQGDPINTRLLCFL